MPHTVLVTGASRGIGVAIARELAAHGHGVVACARGAAELDAQVEALRAELDAFAVAVSLDVSDAESVFAGIERARELCGADRPIDALVNNAGIAVSAPLLSPESDELCERHLAVNFHGARRVAEALLGPMIEAGRGTVVNVASSAALRGYPYVSAYCASKHALLGWSRAARAELAPKGVVVHTVCPHYVDSPMLEASVERVVEKTGRTREEARDFFAAENPGGALVRPEQVAATVRTLIEGDGPGQVLELDGSAAPLRVE